MQEVRSVKTSSNITSKRPSGTSETDRKPMSFTVAHKRLITGLLVLVASGLATDAAAEMWRCPCGGEEFALDDRDTDFKETFKRRHIAAHCARPPLPPPVLSHPDPISPPVRDNDFENQKRDLGGNIRRHSPREVASPQDQFSRERDDLIANIRIPNSFEREKTTLHAEVMPKSRAMSWASLWRSYQDCRDLAYGVAPEADRCAIALSAALDLRPRRSGDFSLKDVAPEKLNEGFRGASVLTRYYVRAAQLAERLSEQLPFGKPPEIFENALIARRKIAGKRGIIYFEDADFRLRSLSWSGDHIDVWDQYFTGSPYAFNNKARRIWFWEFPDEGR